MKFEITGKKEEIDKAEKILPEMIKEIQDSNEIENEKQLKKMRKLGFSPHIPDIALIFDRENDKKILLQDSVSVMGSKRLSKFLLKKSGKRLAENYKDIFKKQGIDVKVKYIGA